MMEPITTDRIERLTFGGLIIVGNLMGMGILVFFKIPQENATVFGQIAGGLSACLGIIAAATWKTTMAERQQAQTIQTLATTAAAIAPPVTTTTTTTVEKTSDGQAATPGVSNPATGNAGNGGGGPQPASGSGADGDDAADAAPTERPPSAGQVL